MAKAYKDPSDIITSRVNKEKNCFMTFKELSSTDYKPTGILMM